MPARELTHAAAVRPGVVGITRASVQARIGLARIDLGLAASTTPTFVAVTNGLTIDYVTDTPAAAFHLAARVGGVTLTDVT